MNKIRVILLVALCFALPGFCDTVAVKKRPHPPFDRQAWLKKTGGWTEQIGKGRPLVIVNGQSRISGDEIEALRKVVQNKINVVTKVVPTRSDAQDCGAVVELLSDDDSPRLLVAPEDGWARVNMTALAVDSPSKEVLKSRLTKELWRGIALVLGASDSLYQPCLMREIHSLKHLDEMQILEPSPEAFNMMYLAVGMLNLQRINRDTYRAACQQGWAPAPTNEFQKAIWEEIHAVPDNPMKIEFDPTSQKGKVSK